MVIVTLVYMATVGVRMLPNRHNGDLTAEYGVREYLSEIKILSGSSRNNPLISFKIFFSLV